MAESQNSSTSSSDKDSLVSNERNISTVVNKCSNKATKTDLASIDDEDGSEHFLCSKEKNGFGTGGAKTDKQEVMKTLHNEQQSNVESKLPKIIKNIPMSLKEGKARENSSPMRGNRSPMRGNRIKAGGATQKTKIETLPKLPKSNFVAPVFKPNIVSPIVTPEKATPDPAKRMHGSHLLKHQVRTIRCYLLHY